jgi:hypothetical protein
MGGLYRGWGDEEGGISHPRLYASAGERSKRTCRGQSAVLFLVNSTTRNLKVFA